MPRRRKVSRATKTTTTGHQEGFGYFQVTQKNGERWSTARGFLDPIRNRPNLRIETDAYTTKIFLDGKRAVGVAYTQHGVAKEARCDREVILVGRRGEVAAYSGIVRHRPAGAAEFAWPCRCCTRCPASARIIATITRRG